MTVLLILCAVGTFVVWRMARRRRKAELAGRVSVKPTYQVEPPRRRMSSLNRESL